MSHIDEGRLAAYLDGELPAGSGELVEIELHVEACAECRKLLEESLRHRNRARTILRSGSPSTTEAPSFDEILRRAGKNASTAGGVTPHRSRLASLAWAATFLVAIGAGWYAVRANSFGFIGAGREQRESARASNERAPALADRTPVSEPAEARETPAAPAPTPPAARANEAPASVLAENARRRDTAVAGQVSPPAATPAPTTAAPPATPQAFASGAAQPPRDSGVAEKAAKTAQSLDAATVTGQASAEQKRALGPSAAKDSPPSAAGAALGRAASAPVAWRETSQAGAMRQLGRLPLQVPGLPVLSYSVRPGGQPEIRVNHDLGQGQVLEVIQTKIVPDSVVSADERNENAAGSGNEIREEAEGYRTTVRGSIPRDSLAVLLRALR